MMMGIKWERSARFTWKKGQVIREEEEEEEEQEEEEEEEGGDEEFSMQRVIRTTCISSKTRTLSLKYRI